MDADINELLAGSIRDAAENNRPLAITGSGSKAGLGREIDGSVLSVKDHSGILNYEPTELVVTARAGTRLDDLETTLAGQNQMLAFDPPWFGADATLGGTIACGLSGPCRPWTGAARDFVLGTEVINGKGELLRFGGEVMKNVAGYDVSRLMTGAWGTLGVISSVSLKVLPRPESEATRVLSMPASGAIQSVSAWCRLPVPLSGAVWTDGQLTVRLSGAENAVVATCKDIGGDEIENAGEFWQDIREHRHPFFAGEEPLWRLSVPRATAWLDLPGEQLLDWGGAQRWLCSSADENLVRTAVTRAGGHATRFRGGDRTGRIFHPLSPTLQRLHAALKKSFDPHNVLNPGRMYERL